MQNKDHGKWSVGSCILSYHTDGAEPDAPAASLMICFLNLHFLAGTTVMGVLSCVILLRMGWKDPSLLLCLTAGLTSAKTTCIEYSGDPLIRAVQKCQF